MSKKIRERNNIKCIYHTRVLTFLSYSVKDFNLLQVDSKTRSHGYGFCGVILVAPSDGPVGMCSAKKLNIRDQQSLIQIKPVI